MSITSLPPELLGKIAWKLEETKDILAFRSTCSLFRQITDSSG